MLKRYKTKQYTEINSHLYNYSCQIGFILSIIITLYILFYPPMPGVADQGDFQRVMSVTGLEEINTNVRTPDSHWFKYVTTQYKMIPLNLARLIGIIPTTSIIYPVSLVRIVCKLFGIQYFNTRLLAFVYTLIYTLSLYICISSIKFKRTSTGIFFIISSLFILIDGNYIIWFNSLYGEPMMIAGLLLFISSVLYAIKQMYEKNYSNILIVFVSAFLFLGAKMQCFAALPLIILLIVRIFSAQDNGKNFIRVSSPINLYILMLIFYVCGIYIQINGTCGIDTKYNSVFYGVLKNSLDPEKDLAVLGLPSDMAVDSGKHAYLAKDKYVKYIPGSYLIQNELTTKVSNAKLLQFYILQPKQLLKGMNYTASQSFDTRGFLGKYEKSAVSKYTFTFNRFTLWSDFRSSKLPKKLSFIIIFYLLIILTSIIEYIKRKGSKGDCLYIELYWLIIIIGLLQFPMPYIGNGEADTSKQLFLFNYTFDITILVACTWIYDSLYSLTNKYIFYRR